MISYPAPCARLYLQKTDRLFSPRYQNPFYRISPSSHHPEQIPSKNKKHPSLHFASGGQFYLLPYRLQLPFFIIKVQESRYKKVKASTFKGNLLSDSCILI